MVEPEQPKIEPVTTFTYHSDSLAEWPEPIEAKEHNQFVEAIGLVLVPVAGLLIAMALILAAVAALPIAALGVFLQNLPRLLTMPLVLCYGAACAVDRWFGEQ